MNKFFDKINLLVLSGLILALSVSSFLIPDAYFSEKENRVLSQLPKLNEEELFSGEYTSTLGDYVADQFPLRDAFVGLKAYSELMQLKRENNGIIYTSEALIPRPTNDISRLTDNFKCINDFAKQNNLSVTVAPIPRVADVFSEFLPNSYPKQLDISVWGNLYSQAQSKSFELLDLYDLLCDSNAYYRTDHHYTTDGAYLVYKALGDCLGYKPKELNCFNIQCVTEAFSGTSVRRSGFYFYDNDRISLYRYNGDTDYRVIADGKEIDLYDFSKLDSTDKYAVFLGGNHSRVDITKDEKNRKKLLIIRDSFADSLVPFLALHFDITLIDLRYYTDSVAELSANENINQVLILENIDELCTAKNLSYLRMK